MQIDWSIEKGLFGLGRAFDALVTTRQGPHDKLSTLKARLDEDWQGDMLPIIEDLYWYPFRNGIAEAPESAEDLRSWLERQYDDAAIIAILLLLLQRYQIRAYNLGGQIGLEFLGIDGTFDLTNAEIIAALDAWAEDLTTQGTEYSLIDTTIEDLTRELPKAREADSSTLLALSAYIALRSAQRNEMIERSERPRMVAQALMQAFQRNGVAHMMYDINGIGCPQICEPWHGRVFPVPSQGGVIPQHPRCDCIWSPVMYDGQLVGYPPVIVNVSGLPTWEAPEDVWTGT